MISMRYARNLARGSGLVWNLRGPRVEGFTNPLWTLVMAAVHRLPLPVHLVCLPVQLLGLGVLAANLFLVRRLALEASGDSELAAALAVALTGTSLNLANWSVQGSEVGALALLADAALLLAVRGLQRGAVDPRLWVLLGAATFVRMDAALLLVTLGGGLAWLDRPRRAAHVRAAVLTAAVALGAQTAFRLAYYGEPLPNTYWLKLTGFPLAARVRRGVALVLDLGLKASPWLLAIPAWAVWRRRTPVILLGAAVLAGQLAYSAWAGGDAWEWWMLGSRYTLIAFPAAFVLFAAGATAPWPGRLDGGGRWWARVAAVAATAVLAVRLNALERPAARWTVWELRETPLDVPSNAENVALAQWVLAHTRAGATVASTWAGTIPYVTDRPAVDLLGKTDAVVAREPARPGYVFYPGHLKWDYAYSLGVLRPDVITHLSIEPGVPPDARPWLGAYRAVRLPWGRVIWVRRTGDRNGRETTIE